ncbi:ABC transporter ATP-binding protein [Chloroflexus sp.]|uniref:ABC transporter ATP-binding protein n=1 Tax=Chloroflexus sp. TaxID=1904827 RepID=UPI00261E5E0D|nr:ABC transporter ATP-binding protein [uncultured Chloroflexus sp.]
MMTKDPSLARRLRWAVRGALFLALLSVVLGGVFTAVIGLFTGQLAPDAGWNQWLRVLLPSMLVWGLGALPFGAALGFFASLIWREV